MRCLLNCAKRFFEIDIYLSIHLSQRSPYATQHYIYVRQRLKCNGIPYRFISFQYGLKHQAALTSIPLDFRYANLPVSCRSNENISFHRWKWTARRRRFCSSNARAISSDRWPNRRPLPQRWWFGRSMHAHYSEMHACTLLLNDDGQSRV